MCFAYFESRLAAERSLTLRARLILRRYEIDAPTVLYVAFRARHLCVYIRRVVRRAIMTCTTRRIRGDRGKSVSLLQVARRTLPFQNGVSFAQASARINTIVASQNVPANPQQRYRRRKDRQPQLHSLERSWPLEIVQVNPLSDRLGCASSSHGVG